MPHPTPEAKGQYWAKLICPDRMPEGEDWSTGLWEVVGVYMFHPDTPENPDQLMALVGGVEPFQPLDAFIWGPRDPYFQPEEVTQSQPTPNRNPATKIALPIPEKSATRRVK